MQLSVTPVTFPTRQKRHIAPKWTIGRYEQQLSCSIPYKLSCKRTRTLTARLWGSP